MARPDTPAHRRLPNPLRLPAPTTPLDRFGALLGWVLYPMLAAFILFDLRVGTSGKPAVVSAELVGLGLLTLLTLPFWWVRRDELTRTGHLVLASFGVVLAYALGSSMVTHLPHLQKVTVARKYLVVPVVTAILTMCAGWGLVLAVDHRARRRWLWWGAVVVVVASILEWPRMALAQHSVRLATGMGGAATVHVVFLLAAAVFAGAAVEGERRRWSWAGAAVSLVLVLATGSRGGLVCLVVAAGLLVVWATARGGLAKVVWGSVAALVAVFAALLALVAPLRRLLVFSDDLRTHNIETALRVFGIGWHNMVFGAGSGRVWPWYAFETGRLKILWRGEVITEFGHAQTNPHSTVLGIMVELGLLALVVFLVMCAALVWRLAREWRAMRSPLLADPTAFFVSIALVASLAANLFDTYLIKNFGVSLWWWIVLAAVLGTFRPDPRRPVQPGDARSARPAPAARPRAGR